VQTIHSHPPAKTVSIVDHYSQVGPPQNDQNCDIGETDEGSAVKHGMSSSDDSIIRPGALLVTGNDGVHETEITDNGAYNTTHKSFLDKRQRHSSVPQTARTQGACAKTKRKIVDGKNMSVMLNKNQIDKAAKDKSGKFTENFKVTLFLVRPNDQTLQAEFSRSNLICQRNYGGSGAGNICDGDKHDSSDESSDEEAAVLRSRSRNLTSDSQSDTISHHSYHSAGAVQDTCTSARHVSVHDPIPAARTLSSHLPTLHVSHVSGMVRNNTEPQQRLSEMTLSQSTWI